MHLAYWLTRQEKWLCQHDVSHIAISGAGPHELHTLDMGRGLGLGGGARSVSPFAVLGLDEEASLTEVKKKFHDLAKEHPPDKRGGSSASKRNFQRLGEAFARLDT